MAEFYDVFRSTLVDLAIPTTSLDKHIAHRATLAGMTTQLEQAGFTVTDVATDAFTMRYANGWALLNHRFIRLGFLPAWRAVVEPGDRERVFAELERRLDRNLSLTIPTACVVGTTA